LERVESGGTLSGNSGSVNVFFIYTSCGLSAGNLFDEFNISLSFSSRLMGAREQGLRSGL